MARVTTATDSPQGSSAGLKSHGSGQTDSLEVSIIIPCLNEAETLEICIRKAQASIQKHGLSAEVIVADNGSTDGSQEITNRCGVRLVSVAEKGYGNALMGGIEAAQGKYIIMGDADDSYDFSNVYPFVEKLREGYDLVMGTRLKGKIMPGAMPWKNRWIGTPVLTGIGKLFFRCTVSDFNCGLRAFLKDAYRVMDLRTTGMEFASEMIVKATLKQMRIGEVPIIFYKDGRSRPPHLHPWRDGWRHLRFQLLYTPRWLFLGPGITLFFLGLLTFAWLLPGPQSVAGIVFDVHTLLVGGLACVLGFQLVYFAVFAEVFAVSEGLLPKGLFLHRIFHTIPLELGLLGGGALILIGLGLLIWSLIYWGQRGFGPLDYLHTMRMLIPSTTLLALGLLTMFSSFFLSFLRLGHK